MLVTTNTTDRPFSPAPETGRYIDPVSKHRARFSKGAELPAGYVLDDRGTTETSIDDERLQKAVAAETEVLKRKTAEAEEKATQAEAARLEAQTLVERAEQAKADETEALKARVAELERELAETDGGSDKDDAAGDGPSAKDDAAGGTPRARRRAANG
jgi:hypothetical protein